MARLLRVLRGQVVGAANDLAWTGAVCVAFGAVAAAVLWPLGHARLVGTLAQGAVALTLLAALAMLALVALATLAGLEADPPGSAMVAIIAAATAALALGWTAWVVLALAPHTRGAAWWAVAVLHVVGLGASWLGTALAGAFAAGTIYRLVATVAMLGGYIAFTLWPGAARALVGGWGPAG